MNRRQKIIVSVTGIFLVLLLLVGLTYAYFLTQITGNTNTKSISVSTANLALVYGDGNGVIEPTDKLLPGTTVDSKTFTVTNQGNATTDYVVVIENVKVTDIATGEETTFESNDFTYTLTCESGCNGVDSPTTFPINGGILVGNSIDVGQTQTYSFTLTYEETGKNQTGDMNKSLEAKINIKDISSINPYSDNTESLAYNLINNAIVGTTGTTLEALPLTQVAATISDYGTGEFSFETVKTSNLYSGYDTWLVGDSSTAAQSGSTVSSYEEAVGKYVYDRATMWTKYLESYDSTTSTLNFKIEKMAPEQTLSAAQDDYGVSYYYRGAVEDNYVTFADMCWRIVRISGDGSIKLILEDQDQVCSASINGNWAIPTTTGGTTYTGNFGYTQYSSGSLTASDGTTNSSTKYVMDYLHGTTSNDSSMATAFKNFQSTFTTNELAKLKAGDWCLAAKGYDSSNNLLTATQMLDNKAKGISFNYDSYSRLGGNNGYKPTLICNGTVLNDWDDTDKTPMYVGTITADEIVYAGGKYDTLNENYYLINEEFKKSSSGENKAFSFWSLSPNNFSNNYDYACDVNAAGYLHCIRDVAVESVAFRPSVSLASSTTISKGDGTIGNPYVVE